MKKVLLKGPVFTSSGYGVHSRQVFKALKSRSDIDLYVLPTRWGNTSWILNVEFNNNIIKDLLEYSKKFKESIEFDESYQVLLPNEWSNIAKKNVGITAGFEADIVKEEWIDFCNMMNIVITPSEFTRLSFVKTSEEFNKKLLTEIKVINEWYYRQFDDSKETKQTAKFLDDLTFKDNILIIGQITSTNEVSDRKNIIKTINTTLKAIEDLNVGLVLKVNIGKNSSLYRNKVIEEVKSKINSTLHNRITFLFGNFSIAEMNYLYSCKNISCMVSGTRAEGWGLPFLESAACGLPIIATDYSAYKEFLEEDFLKVKYELVVFNSDPNFTDIGKNPKWAEFCKEDMILKIHEFFNNKSKYRNIAVNRQKIIKQKYSFDSILDNYKNFFKSSF